MAVWRFLLRKTGNFWQNISVREKKIRQGKKNCYELRGNKTLESGFSPKTSLRLTPWRPNKSYLHLAQYRYQSWSTDDKAYHKKHFRIPCRNHREELEFPHANMKWFVWQWENTMVPLLDNAKTRIKHWNIAPTIFPSLCFVNSTLLRRRFLFFSLQGTPKKFLVYMSKDVMHLLGHITVWSLCLADHFSASLITKLLAFSKRK